jgi:hypothetical protein
MRINGPSLLVVGHPGHELRVHGWLEMARPTVMVLTDGSGHLGTPRLDQTTALLLRAGASCGDVYGRLTDADVYDALLSGDTSRFLDLATEIARVIVRDDIATVVGDEREGYNPAHDVCRLVIDAAVGIARDGNAGPLDNYAFPLMGAPDLTGGPHNACLSRFELDDRALERKLAAARDYVGMADEVEHALAAWGAGAFRTETFRRVDPDEGHQPSFEPPYYERYGEKRVSHGAYDEVIRYQDHVKPLADALRALETARLQ